MKLVLALLASAGAMELNADNFKTEVFESGKNAFVKFLAPCEAGVSGYPTIKYWTDGADMAGASPYQGGRDLAALQKHVEDNMLPKCDAKDPENSGCDDQEIAYVAKMTEKGADAIAKEATRLEGMKGSAMKPDKKAWLLKRINVLKGLSA
ncbi:hypothetical protein JL720_9016 [Aureococcus anophagefferens]|nr:hypothetical protein JL720_9016 [Aureococcus anophagefferens]